MLFRSVDVIGPPVKPTPVLIRVRDPFGPQNAAPLPSVVRTCPEVPREEGRVMEVFVPLTLNAKAPPMFVSPVVVLVEIELLPSAGLLTSNEVLVRLREVLGTVVEELSKE